MQLINIRSAGSALLLLHVAGFIVNGQPVKAATVTFQWERSLEIGESEIPFKVSIPVVLSVNGLPDKAKPGDSFQPTVEITPSEGAFIQFSDRTFSIDAAIERAAAKPYEIDLSKLTPLTSSLITKLLEEELRLPHEAAESLSSTVQDRVKLILSSDLKVSVETRGAATVNPQEISTWFNQPTPQTIKISRNARDGDEIELSYFANWRLILKMDLSEEIYNNPVAGPMMKKLAQLIGLPLTREIGIIQGDEKLTHIIQVQTPYKLTFGTILAGIGLVAVAVSIGIIVLLKYPRKPAWR